MIEDGGARCDPATPLGMHRYMAFWCVRVLSLRSLRGPWMGHLPEGTVRRRNATHLPPHLWRRAVPSGGTEWASSGCSRHHEQMAYGQSRDDRGEGLMRETQPERHVGQQRPDSQ
jgi:hypothetical protein